ncbi:MAG: hypothetical protein R3C59_11005 [Planctomycetaceae bacterium]
MTKLPLRERLAMLSVAEASAELQVDGETLAGLLESGELRYVQLDKSGKRICIIRCDLLEYQQRRAGTLMATARSP